METTVKAPLTNLQLELLKMYAFNLPDDDLREIRRMLAKFFYKKMAEQADKDWTEERYTPELMDEWLKVGAK